MATQTAAAAAARAYYQRMKDVLREQRIEKRRQQIKALIDKYGAMLGVSQATRSQCIEMIDSIRSYPGFSIDTKVIAALYLVARRPGNDLILLTDVETVAENAGINRKKLRSCIRKMNSMLQISSSGMTPERIIRAYWRNLGLKREEVKRAEQLLSLIDSRGGDPRGWAAAAVYLVLNGFDENVPTPTSTRLYGREVTEIDVATAFNISEPTVRGRIKALLETMNFGSDGEGVEAL